MFHDEAQCCQKAGMFEVKGPNSGSRTEVEKVGPSVVVGVAWGMGIINQI